MDDHESSHRSLPNVSNTNTSSSSPPDNPPPPPNCNNFKTNNNTIHHLPNTNTNTTTNNNNTIQNNNNNNNNSVSSNSHAHHNKEQDRFLPIANVGRIMKKVIPGNGKISKDAKETVQECVSEFISFVTGEASDKCQREKRKTINGDDIIWAITTLGFEDYVAPLKTYLNKYRQIEEDKINNVPKQQQQHRTGSVQNHDPTQHDHAGAGGSHQSLAGFTGLYSSSSPSPTSFLPHHHHHHHFSGGAGTEQGFMLPFSAPMPKQLQQQDNQIDSGGRHW